MIIWSGKGILVFIVIFLDSLFANLITDAVTHEDHFYNDNFLPVGVSFIISAIVIKLLAQLFTFRARKKMKTEEEIRLMQKHDRLFFIPFVNWALICLVIGVGLIIYQCVKSA